MLVASKVYRVGVIGFAHMHVNELIDQFDRLENVRWVACADTQPSDPNLAQVAGTRAANLKRALEKTGIPKRYDDYRELLEKEELDILIVCAENTRSADVTVEALSRGMHVLREKPMAASYSDALRMARAARHNGVTVATNWPTTWRPAIRRAKELIDAGEIGRVWEVKWRNGASLGPLAYGSAHPGATIVDGRLSEAALGAEWWYQHREGGGALLDYCCYGACLASWYIPDEPISVVGTAANLCSHFGDVEDNAVFTVRYPNALAIIEATWTTFHVGIPTGPIIYGTEGTMVVDGNRVLVYKERGKPEPTRVIEDGSLPEGRDTIAKEFIHHLETGEPLHPTLDLAINTKVMAILDAGRRSSQSGKVELVNNPSWQIG